MNDRSSIAALVRSTDEHVATSFLSRSTAVALWRVLNAMRDGWYLEKRLRDVARLIAADARSRGLRAEQMVVALKHEWPTLLERRRVPAEEELGLLAEKLTSLCIHEYYTPRASGESCAVQACRTM
jgi:hypothetical protein